MRHDEPSFSFVFPFVSGDGFLRAPPLGTQAEDDVDFVVCGVPVDVAVTNRPGARFGPSTIRRASHMLCEGTHPWFGVSPVYPKLRLRDAGDLRLPHTTLPAMREALERQAQALLQQHHVLWLGGDHSITLSLLRAHYAVRGEPLAVLHFDAHCDTWTDHFNEPSGHGTWVHEAVQEGLVDVKRFVQVGIRSSAHAEARDYVESRGGLAIHARELRGRCGTEQLEDVLDAIREHLGSAPAYLTLDIDCLDPAYAPGTGTPEPAGLSSAQVMTFLEELVPACNFVGMDVVEVAPAYDHAELTSLAAAHFAWTYLSAQVAKQEGWESQG